MNQLLLFCLCCLVVALGGIAFALPPLGLTAVDPAFGGIEIIDGTAYITASGGMRTVSSAGEVGFIPITHPTLGIPISVTRAVKASDGILYAAANFTSVAPAMQSALYRLDQPTIPIVTWNDGVGSVDADLKGYGNVDGSCFGCYIATYFNLDGSSQEMPFPAGSDNTNNTTYVISSTPRGYAIGDAGIPGTAGAGPVLWTPNGEISFLPGQVGIANSIRDRNSATKPNLGWNDFDAPIISYGDGRGFSVLKEDGSSFYQPTVGIRVTVSHSDFGVIQVSEGVAPTVVSYFAFYPGIVPGFDNRAVPLLDIFPELAAVDIDRVNSLASVDGYLYMTLSGADGTFLFGARDPSVVPEPATVVFALFGAAAWFRRRR
jgi:hypothetical protein